MNIKIKRLRDSAVIPKYWSDGAVGCDLHADLGRIKCGSTIWPHDSLLISTGLSMAIPKGYGGFILPKSGLGHKTGLILGNSVGVIDSDYRGEIFISAYNRTGKHIKIKHGQRIAQMIFKKVEIAEFIECELDDTVRDDGGFGSTDTACKGKYYSKSSGNCSHSLNASIECNSDLCLFNDTDFDSSGEL